MNLKNVMEYISNICLMNTILIFSHYNCTRTLQAEAELVVRLLHPSNKERRKENPD